MRWTETKMLIDWIQDKEEANRTWFTTDQHFGHAAIIAGSIGKSGAAAMATTAALRIGTGLVTAATPASVNPILEAKLLEAMTVPMPETERRLWRPRA